MTKRSRALIVSIVTLCLCLILSISATYALFTNQVNTNIHLDSGNLTIGLYRTSYQTKTLGTDGTLSVTEDKKSVDLTEDGSKVFDISNAVPGCWYKAELTVENLGNVAFDYGVRLIWSKDQATQSQQDFADQLTVTIIGDESHKATFKLSAATDVSLGYMLVDNTKTTSTFTVQIEFDDINATENNKAQSVNLSVDLQVYATQKLENLDK
jgi:hypothetical protein